jgi:hypothetical protein
MTGTQEGPKLLISPQDIVLEAGKQLMNAYYTYIIELWQSMTRANTGFLNDN